MTLNYLFNTVNVNSCKDKEMVKEMCCVLSSGLGRPKNAVVDEFGGYCGFDSPTKPSICPNKTVAATTTNTTATTETPAKTRLL